MVSAFAQAIGSYGHYLGVKISINCNKRNVHKIWIIYRLLTHFEIVHGVDFLAPLCYSKLTFVSLTCLWPNWRIKTINVRKNNAANFRWYSHTRFTYRTISLLRCLVFLSICFFCSTKINILPSKWLLTLVKKRYSIFTKSSVYILEKKK